MAVKLNRTPEQERAAWLKIARDFVAGEYNPADRSMKESIAIGVSCFAADPEFRKLFKLPPLRKGYMTPDVRQTLKDKITI